MYTSAIAKEITVRDIDRSCTNLHGNEKKTWEKNQYIYKMYYCADKQNIQMQKRSSPYLYITSTVCPEFAQNRQYLNHLISKFKKNHHFRRILDI
jgi:hypothetical protein